MMVALAVYPVLPHLSPRLDVSGLFFTSETSRTKLAIVLPDMRSPGKETYAKMLFFPMLFF